MATTRQCLGQVFLAVAVLALAVSLASAQSSGEPAAPKSSPAGAPASAARESWRPATPAGRPGYLIGIGDRLKVFNYEEAKEYDCVVRPDGRVTLPLVGDVAAEGTVPETLAKEIAKRLEPYQKQATIFVTVTEIHSYRVYVIGQVRTVQEIERIAPLRLLQAIAISGGPTEFAKKEVTVLREGPRGKERIEIDYGKILAGKAPEMDVWLQSGDVVVMQ